MGGNITGNPRFRGVCAGRSLAGLVGAGRRGPPVGRTGAWRCGGVGALLGPEGTGPAVRPLGVGGPVVFSLVVPGSFWSLVPAARARCPRLFAGWGARWCRRGPWEGSWVGVCELDSGCEHLDLNEILVMSDLAGP